jgi:hypothetical protein
MDKLEQITTRYLLGELSESEQIALEEKYFTDPQVFDQVLQTESELVDGYVRSRLPEEVRERFEKFYMAHPERNDRVKFAAALASRLERIEETATPAEQPARSVLWWQRLFASLLGQRPKLRFTITFATLLIMIGGIWLLLESRRWQRESGQIQAAGEAGQQRERERAQQAEEERRRAEELAAEQKRVETGPQQIPQPAPTPILNPAPSRSVSLALVVGGVRGSDNSRMPTLVILPDATQARLMLNLQENDYQRYDASLQRVAGAEIFSRKGIKPGRAKNGASLIFTVPTSKLARGDYVLTLRGVNLNGEIDDLSKSLFRVEKR